MSRVTDSEVQAILGNHYQSGRDLTPFITAASLITDKVSTCATAMGEALTTEELTNIELWLSAHAYTVDDRRPQRERTMDTERQYDNSSYLDMAKALDTSGCLTQILSKESKKKPRIHWIGSTWTESQSYEERN